MYNHTHTHTHTHIHTRNQHTPVGNRSENSLKELHSFNPIKYSKGKTVSCVAWHPTREGVVAFATTNNLAFDQWVDYSGQVLSSWILIWNFQVRGIVCMCVCVCVCV
jgi:hypothetical protein